MESKYEWIHELIKAEEQMEETGMIDFGSPRDPERILIGAALTFLGRLRKEFQEAIEIFNDHKTFSGGKIKLYGIAKTPADFMIFRNGYRLIFSLKQPGVISIRTHFMNPTLPAVTTMNLMGDSVMNQISSPQFRGKEDLLEVKWGPFHEVIWTYQSQAIKIESAVQHYLTQFIQDSTTPGN